MSNGYHYLNGEYVDKDKCFVHVTDLGIQRSFAVFDYFIFIDQVPLYVEDNLVRFRNSISKMNVPLKYTDNELLEIIMKLIDKNATTSGGIKLIFTGGYAANGYDADIPNLILMHLPFPHVPSEYYDKGVKLILEEFERDFPTAKTTDYFFSLSVKEKIKRNNAFDVLYQKEGIITESSRSNFFIVDGDRKIITNDKGILEGITRKHLISVAKDHFEIEFRSLFTSELTNAHEAFMTSSVKRVMPVTQIDENSIGNGKPGPVTKTLMRLLKEKDLNYISSFNES